MSADLTPAEVAALRADAEVMLGGVGRFDPATVLALIDAGFDDTGQPWRDRAERAEALADSMQHFADVAERVERRNNELVAERDVARATIDRARTLTDHWETGDLGYPAHPMEFVRDLRRVLDGDQETT